MSRTHSQYIRVTKKFTFDMAHALYGHDGPCSNIHGHTYVLYITLKGRTVNDVDNPKYGMVMDFSDLKKIVQQQVINFFDHSLVLNADSPHADLRSITGHFEKVHFVKYQPSCENMLIDILDRISDYFSYEVVINNIRLEETPTSYAEWYAEDN